MLKAFFQAATAFLNAWPLFAASKLHNQIDEIDDEIFKLGLDGSGFAKLRIEQLGKRRERLVEQISALRPADSDLDPR